MPKSEQKYLLKRGDHWYVRVRVPAEAQHVLGPELCETTRTSSLDEAKRRRWSIRETFLQRIDAARVSTDPGSPSWLVAEMKRAVRELAERPIAAKDYAIEEGGRQHTVSEDEAHDPLSDLIDRLVKVRKLKRDENGHPIIPDKRTDNALVTAARILRAGPDAELFSAVKETYLNEKESSVTRQTLNGKRRDLQRFEDWHGDAPIASIARRKAGDYVAHLLTRGDAPKTTQDAISNLGAFFVWARRRGKIDGNPFEDQAGTVTESKRGGAKWERRAWTADELRKMLEGLDRSKPIHARMFSLVALGAFTGARLNELCEAKTEDAQGDRLMIRQGKTKAAVRAIPLHPSIRPLVKRLAEGSSDGYLISGLTAGGENKTRGHHVSKRLGTFKRKLGVVDLADATGAQVTPKTQPENITGKVRDRIDFHAFRRTVNSLMSAAGVRKEVRKAIVGHENGGDVNERHYLDPEEFKALAKAVQKVDYGRAVDELVRRAK